MTLLLQYMLMFASVLLLVALGGCFSEHSGVINIGLEGIMVFGALGGALMMKYMPDGTAVVVVILLTTLMAVTFGCCIRFCWRSRRLTSRQTRRSSARR